LRHDVAPGLKVVADSVDYENGPAGLEDRRRETIDITN
jgi:hypothetical protein